MSDLFDPPSEPEGPVLPDPPVCESACRVPSKKKGGRGKESWPEQKQRTLDLTDAVKTKDPDVMVRAMAVALYRLGAEPLNDVAELMLSKLKEGIP